METVTLSKKSTLAAEKLKSLYKQGKVFVGKTPAVQRSHEVYLAACRLADLLGGDLARHIGTEASGQAHYEILYNMRFLFRVHVGPGRCAVGVYDFAEGTCSYAGLVSC